MAVKLNQCLQSEERAKMQVFTPSHTLGNSVQTLTQNSAINCFTEAANPGWGEWGNILLPFLLPNVLNNKSSMVHLNSPGVDRLPGPMVWVLVGISINLLNHNPCCAMHVHNDMTDLFTPSTMLLCITTRTSSALCEGIFFTNLPPDNVES